MHRGIYIDSIPGEVRIALVEEGFLAEVSIDRPAARGVAGNVYLGRVRTVLPGLQAAFVDLGLERDGFLHVEDVLPPSAVPGGTREDARIEDQLRDGQELVVQVSKEPMGQKGARITAHLALPGRFLILLPGIDHTGVSRRIEDASERERLRALADDLAKALGAPGGFIVRTSGAQRSAGDLEPEARTLVDLWTRIGSRREASGAPALLHEEAGAIARALRDLCDEAVAEVVVDAPELLREAAAGAECDPDLARRIRLHDGPRPLFETMGLDAQLDRALRPRVWLKSGGFIVINQTEALVAIDVNTGKYVGRLRHEETIVRTNLEAVREIVRQIRLRDLGGIIVIDLIDMEAPDSRATLVTALEQELRKDRARSRMLPISEFGLIEITRQRIRPGLDGIMCRPCPSCGGAGRSPSVQTLGLAIVRAIRRLGPDLGGGRVVVRVHPGAGLALRKQEDALAAAGNLPAERLALQDDPELRPDQWVLRVD
ncbi:MAG TPA: Rne/Rng family ribonuclease [Candidatus Cryosericum sp.]|nr:Rne/Rng family ribonuclease [Candidatus Cryosericum sp.]